MRQREGGWSSLYIAGDLIRGHTETIILARLMQRDSYGYEINQNGPGAVRRALRAEGGHALHRVQAVGGDRADHVLLGQRGYGRRRRYYRITPAGRMAYQEQVSVWEATKEIIDRLIAMEEES